MRLESKVILLIAIFITFICLIFSLMVPVEILADATDTSEILVNISESAQIEVNPTNLQWLQVSPGGNSSVTRVTVQNTGSTTFSNGIYVSVDSWANSTNNPTANDDVTKFMAGSFLVITNSTYYDTTYWFVNQISWNETTYPDPVSPTTGAVSWGYFHNKTESWLWELNGSTAGDCANATGGDGSLKIKTTVDVGAGSRDLSTATAAGTWQTNTSDW